jgi:mRNA-degrading endonuclease RelE of RelBE toxin-antitoxin system
LSDVGNWRVKEPPDILRILRRVGYQRQKKYLQLLEKFKTNPNPRKLGRFKKGAKLGCYVAELDASFRVSYNIYYDQRIIEILDVDDHKGIYGKDKHS